MSMGITVEDFKYIRGVNDAEYIELLKNAYEGQKYITSKAIAKLKEQPEIIRCYECVHASDIVPIPNPNLKHCDKYGFFKRKIIFAEMRKGELIIKMDKGNKIAYAIFKEVSRFSFYEWLKEWDIEEADWDKFIKAGVEVFNNEDDSEKQE